MRQHEFVTYDDDLYVTDNPMVARGLTADGLRWAFTAGHASNWHPLTWLSHMLDAQLFGVEAAGAQHQVNALLHALNAALLLLVLFRYTGDLWPSSLVAAFFALHPLRVESVAWISERKDLLAAFFFLLMLAAYARYIRRPGAGRYALVFLALLFGLMAKPMLVSAPLVLLLLDRWPLGRSGPGTLRRRLVEKLPLFALALASCIVTPIVQAQSGTMRSLAALPLAARVSNAFVASVRYVVSTVWPTDLAVYYPHPAIVEATTYSAFGLAALVAVVLVVAALIVAVRSEPRYPYLTVGLLWTAVMLAPVIGLVQVGEQARADRYTYLPLIGVTIAAVWGVFALVRVHPGRRRIATLTAAALLLGTHAVAAHRQIQTWRTSETLFRHALAVTERNYVAHNNLALALMARGELNQAANEFQAALDLRPGDPRYHSNLGLVAKLQGDTGAAEEHFRIAIAAWPEFAGAHTELGVLAFRRDDTDTALAHLRRAAKLRPGDARVQNNLATVLMARAEWDAASQRLERAVRIEPRHADHQAKLGATLLELGRWRAAAARLEKALQLQPTPAVNERLAWLRATCPLAELRDGSQAVLLAERAASAHQHGEPRTLATLAAAQAEAGDFATAERWQRVALELAPNHVEAPAWRRRLQLFAAHTPYHEATR